LGRLMVVLEMMVVLHLVGLLIVLLVEVNLKVCQLGVLHLMGLPIVQLVEVNLKVCQLGVDHLVGHLMDVRLVGGHLVELQMVCRLVVVLMDGQKFLGMEVCQLELDVLHEELVLRMMEVLHLVGLLIVQLVEVTQKVCQLVEDHLVGRQMLEVLRMEELRMLEEHRRMVYRLVVDQMEEHQKI
jgi:hypothetical protein